MLVLISIHPKNSSLTSNCLHSIRQLFFYHNRKKFGIWKAHSQEMLILKDKRETLLHAVSGSWKLPLPAPATMVAKNQCLTCCLTCCFWCWISHWVLLILSWNMWLRGRSGGLWLGRDPGGVGGSVKIGDWVFWSCWNLSLTAVFWIDFSVACFKRV